MARLFDDGASQYLTHAAAVVTANPWTIAGWFRSNDATTAQTIISLGVSGSDTDRIQLQMEGTVAGDILRLSVNAANPSSFADSTTGMTANKWHHGCGSDDGTTLSCYIDGGSKGTASSDDDPSGLDVTYIGTRRLSGSLGGYWSGDLAECAIWNVVLSDAEVAELATGVCPLFVRPDNLVAYWPVIGAQSPEPDWVGGYNMTVSGATKSDHPRIIYPGRKKPNAVAPATAAVTGTATASINESDVVTGGKTIIITLANDTWIAAGAGSFDLQRDEILQGLDSAQSEATGWNAIIRDLELVTAVVRTSDTVVTITLNAAALYDITAQETITVTVPGTAVNGTVAITATPTFTVSTVGGAAGLMFFGTNRYANRHALIGGRQF